MHFPYKNLELVLKYNITKTDEKGDPLGILHIMRICIYRVFSLNKVVEKNPLLLK